jgi:glutamate racemase
MVGAVTNVPWQIEGPVPAILPAAQAIGIFAQPELVAKSLAAYLARHGEFDPPAGPRAATQFLTTGDPAAASALAKRFFGSALRFQKV